MDNTYLKLYKFLFLFFWFAACILGFKIKSYAQEWQELKSEHFIVYFIDSYTDNQRNHEQISGISDEKFAQEVLYKAEAYYQGIASDLGYPRYSDCRR